MLHFTKTLLSIALLLSPLFVSAYDCSYATEISCGDNLWYGPTSTSHFGTSDYDFSDCGTNLSWSYNGGDRLFYFDAGAYPKTVTLTLNGLDGDLDLLVFQECRNGYGSPGLSDCVATSLKGGTAEEKVTISNAVGVYYVVVDAYSSSIRSGFDLIMSCSNTTTPSYGCSSARPLRCGDNLWVNAPTVNHFDGNDYDFSGCFSNSYSFSGKDHLYRIDLGTTPQNVTIEMSGLSADLDMFLFRRCNSGYGATFSQCVDHSYRSSTSNEIITLNNASGTYYLVVDNNDPWYNSGYELSMSCSSAQTSYDCSHAVPLRCGDNKWVNAPSTNHFGAGDYDFSNCFNQNYSFEGKDHLYKIEAGSTPVDLNINLTGLSADLDMFLFKTCANHYGEYVLESCQAFSYNSGSRSESITLPNATGTYYLAIDGNYPQYNSGYEISLSCVYPTPSYDCSDARPLYCGGTKWVPAPTSNHLSGSDYDFSGCGGYSYTYNGKDHLYKISVGNRTKDIEIILNGLSADMDMFLFSSCESHYGQSVLGSCVAIANKSGSSAEKIVLNNASGDYYLAIDSYSASVSSDYDIELKCSDPTPTYGCSYAIDLSCGSSKWMSAPSYNHYEGSDYDMSDCGGSSWGGYKGKDQLFKINVGSSPRDLKIKLSGLSADMDMFLFRSCENHYGNQTLENCVGYSIKSGNKSELIEVSNASGIYYLSVDGYSSYATSGYEIEVECDTYTPPSYDCYNVETLTCGETKWAPAPSTNSFSGNDYDFSGCGSSGHSYTGKDDIYKVRVGSSARDLTIIMNGLSDDMDILLFRACTDHYGNEVLEQCVGRSTRSGTAQEEIHVANASGDYYLVVDGKTAWDASAYDIIVRCENTPPPSTDCSGTPISCGDVVTASNSATDSRSSDRLNRHDECTYGSGYGGREVIFTMNGGATGIHHVTIDLHRLSYTTDLDLFVYRDCTADYNQYNNDWDYSMNNNVVCSQNQNSKTESIFINFIAPGEDIFIVVDARSTNNGNAISQFELAVSCGSVCDKSSTTIDCGETISSTTVGAGNRTSYFSCDSEANNWGPEKVYKLVIEETTDIEINLDVKSNADLNLYLNSSCAPTGCKAYSKSGGAGQDESITQRLYRGTYYITVEGYQGDAGAFDLSVLGCGCDIDGTLACDESISGTTVNASNTIKELKGSCFETASYPLDLDGGDRVYEFTATETADYTFGLTGLSDNLDLFAVSDCDDTDACLGFSTKTGDEDESLTISIEAGETVLIVVDSHRESWESAFTLSVSCTPPMACIDVEQRGDQSVVITLPTVDTSCGAATVVVYEKDGDIRIDTLSDALSVMTDSSYLFIPETSAAEHVYEICYEIVCDTEPFVCCETVTTDPVLSCGETFSGTTEGKTSQFDADDFDLCYSSSSSFDGPDDLIRFTKEDSSSILEITMSHDRSNLSLFIFDENLMPANMSCKGLNFNGSKIISNTATKGEVWTDADDLLPAGTYYALIEGFETSISADYTLSISCRACPAVTDTLVCGDDIFGEILAAGSEISRYTYSGSGTVVAYSAGEDVYALDFAQDAAVTISLTGMSSDLDLFLVQDLCDSMSTVAMSITEGDEQIVAVVDSGDYYLVVDGWNGAHGSYQLSITGCDDPGAIAPPQAVIRSAESALSTRMEVTVSPNPFADRAVISIQSITAQQAQLQLFTADGALLHGRQLQLNKGRNNVQISGTDINQHSGLILYRVTTGDEAIQGRMIRVN